MNFLIILFGTQSIFIFLSFINFISKKLMIDFLRFSYASFLLFSGFVKLIDPLGFSYKLQEYFEVFGMEWLIPLSLFLSVFIILFELFLGLFLILGFQIKKVMWGNLLLMLFFTFLTFFSAYFNKVTDCGCFGDFMKLDPWHSFFKDLHLLFISSVLFFYQNRISQLFKFSIIRNTLIACFFLLSLFTTYTLLHLPFVDFRAYQIGTNIINDRKLPKNAKKDIYEDVWYYEIDGEIKEFNTDDQPWKIEGAIFKDRLTKLIFKGDEPAIHDFDILDEKSGLDMTDSILSMQQVFLVISYDIDKTNIAAHVNINNKLFKETSLKDILIYGISSSSLDEVANKLSHDELYYEYFSADQTTLKTIVRSNPGVLMLENGVIVNKWHWRDFPDELLEIINQ